ncbi:TetR family transcriptional regulator [Bacillus coahuilensis m2-6]|uniref:TetR/AcrR family transcriptional regulator n=1 Tax=Bacillus coahuilensis TaxID=408580 RepID=UPI0007506AD5|nr:TetR/AcrR family transcriptional regulator [Bacillus coahuilensis]KUP09168.1 TetR family transcriptional regulator [Bacillus coahuilensis m2-6]
MDRKKHVVEAATKSFAQYGYKATTMDQVAKLANVGKGTIYTFYKNKDELFIEIVTSLILEMKGMAEEAMQGKHSFYEKAHAALYRILEFRKEHQLTIKLLQEEREIGTPIVQQVVDKMERSIISYIEHKVSAAIVSGEIEDCNPKLTAFVMFKLYIALIFDWEKYADPLTENEIAKLFEMYLLKGLSL